MANNISANNLGTESPAVIADLGKIESDITTLADEIRAGDKWGNSDLDNTYYSLSNVDDPNSDIGHLVADAEAEGNPSSQVEWLVYNLTPTSLYPTIDNAINTQSTSGIDGSDPSSLLSLVQAALQS